MSKTPPPVKRHPKHNLLVVDWDYFFPTDQRWGWKPTEKPELIDGPVWMDRAAQFGSEEFPEFDLPQPDQKLVDRFWDQFIFVFGTRLYYADSNKFAPAVAAMEYEDAAVTDVGVWLFDQHHDSGYKGDNSRPDMLANGVSCENWMLMFGGKKPDTLHVVYPDWHEEAFEIEPEPAIKGLDRRFRSDVDNSEFPVFDGIFVCRSGAWVPPWCDIKFHAFIESSPALEKINMDGVEPRSKWLSCK